MTKLNLFTGAILPIDKPYRMSSFGALAHIRYLLSQRTGSKVKVGHAGTLDPLATGVLLLCTGRATKLIPELQTHTKEYVAGLQLGATTASYDREHTVNATYPTEHITEELVRQKLLHFVGDIEQVPPTYSACKVEGTRSYMLRRQGEDVKLRAKHVRIDAIELLSFDPTLMQMTLRVTCGKGTYIRALARDVGRSLGSGAFLTSLRRTRAGGYTVDNCIDFDHFEEWLDQQYLEGVISNEAITV